MEITRCDHGETRFSAWTPVTNKTYNQKLFRERSTLILHWFDLWSDRQRKEFISQLLRRCSKTQLKFTRDCLTEVVPITQQDFTTVLPRFLSLYIMSFLSPRDVCAVAQVCWYWRFLAEQDCLWSPKCIRLGWFLPYCPSDHECGAWKRHYIACVSSLDVLTPREAAEIYSTLSKSWSAEEENQERKKEQKMRQAIREKIAEHKRVSMKTRGAWLNPSKVGTPLTQTIHKHIRPLSLTSSLVQLGEKYRWKSSLSSVESRERRLDLSLTGTFTNVQIRQPGSQGSHPPHFLLVSSSIPGYEMLLAAVQVSVVVLSYDSHGTTMQALLSLVERAIEDRMLQSIGIVAEGSAETITLTEGLSINEKNILKPRVREFWEKLCSWVVPQSDGGCLNIFAPLAASVAGVDLMGKLSTVTGLRVRAPTGICTGSFQHVLSEWSESGEFPPFLYLHEAAFLSWCRQAEWIEEACKVLRKRLEPHLHSVCQEIRGRTLGLFLWNHIKIPIQALESKDLLCLLEGLVEMTNKTQDDPLDFLGHFLLERSAEVGLKNGDHESVSFNGSHHDYPTDGVDRRRAVFKELLESEKAYVEHLQAVASVYYSPLRSALDSNRAIITSLSLLSIFCPVLDILEANTVFLKELMERWGEWGLLQCVGDVCIKFCNKLRVYTNFFNNYPAMLKSIDKCRETIPAFRTFLKRHDRTIETRMLSLQELFLRPSARVGEYVTLLQALTLHTLPEHPDHTHLSSALKTLTSYKSFIHKLKKSLDQDFQIQEAQNKIQCCPNLLEDSRYLITTQEVALLSCINGDIAACLRMYEHVSDLGLFLFNDALVVSEKSVSSAPFCLSVKATHTFLASMALHCLTLTDIADSKYVQNAFLLESPLRRWICATERKEDKIRLLSALSSATNAAISQH